MNESDLINDSIINDGSGELYIDINSKTIFINEKCKETLKKSLTRSTLQSFLQEEWICDPHKKNLSSYQIPCVNLDWCNPPQMNGWKIVDDFNVLENIVM